MVAGDTDAGVTGVGRLGGANGGMRETPASRAGAAPNDCAASRDTPSCGRAAAVGGVAGGTVAVGGAGRGGSAGEGTGAEPAVTATDEVAAPAGTGAGEGAANEEPSGIRAAVEAVVAGGTTGTADVGIVEVTPAELALLAAWSGLRTIELGKSSAQRTLAPTGINPPQIEQRARRLAPVTFTGSTR